MRKLKFRAWHKESKEMLYPEKQWYLFGWLEDEKQPIEVMQYTGLKDKDGKEIYEGDIVTLEEDENKEYFNEPYYLKYGDILAVEWSDVNLAYYLMPINGDEEQQMDYYGAWGDWNWIKVIGNIYENPELLEE